jgi:hypothetical protein
VWPVEASEIALQIEMQKNCHQLDAKLAERKVNNMQPSMIVRYNYNVQVV